MDYNYNYESVTGRLNVDLCARKKKPPMEILILPRSIRIPTLTAIRVNRYCRIRDGYVNKIK